MAQLECSVVWIKMFSVALVAFGLLMFGTALVAWFIIKHDLLKEKK